MLQISDPHQQYCRAAPQYKLCGESGVDIVVAKNSFEVVNYQNYRHFHLSQTCNGEVISKKDRHVNRMELQKKECEVDKSTDYNKKVFSPI